MTSCLSLLAAAAVCAGNSANAQPTAKTADRATAVGAYEHLRRARVTVTAEANLAGSRFTLQDSSGKTLALGAFQPGDAAAGRATAQVTFPMPPRGNKPLGALKIMSDTGETLGTLTLPDADAVRRDAFANAALRFRGPNGAGFVFSGTRFPEPDFAEPTLIEDAIGPYTLSTIFYDADRKLVTQADRPGRYAAVVTIMPDDGSAAPTTKRYVTLFRLPDGAAEASRKLPERERAAAFTPRLPEGALGVSGDAAREQSAFLGDYLAGRFRDGLRDDPGGAILLAGLFESRPGDSPTARNSPTERNRRWTFALRQTLGAAPAYRYLVNLPAGYDPNDADKRWPVLLFLHGSGERGDDLEKVKVHGPPKVAPTRPDFPFIVISPQCPANDRWLPAELAALLDEVAAKYRTAADRVYLTGLSMGGYGTWSLAAEYPGRFAAIAPICGGGDPTDTARVRQIPAWVFHGGKDPVVPVERAHEMVDALKKTDAAEVKLTIYPDAGHDSWTVTYDNPELYAWLLAHKRAPAVAGAK